MCRCVFLFLTWHTIRLACRKLVDIPKMLACSRLWTTVHLAQHRQHLRNVWNPNNAGVGERRNKWKFHLRGGSELRAGQDDLKITSRYYDFHDDAIYHDIYYAMNIMLRDKRTWHHMTAVRVLIHEPQCCSCMLCFRSLLCNSTHIWFVFVSSVLTLCSFFFCFLQLIKFQIKFA